MATTKKTTKTAATDKPSPQKQATAKPPAAKKTGAKKSAKKMSALDAAAELLGETDEPLSTKQMIDQMAAKGYWKSPGGQTPWATLYSALHREIEKKGKDARFKKADRGLFTANK